MGPLVNADPTPWTADPETGLQRTHLATFGAWLAQRRAETGITTVTRNSGNRRTTSKKALLQPSRGPRGEVVTGRRGRFSGAPAPPEGPDLTTIAAAKAFAEWQEDPASLGAYEALAPQYELASALIAARTRAGLIQARLTERIGTSQSAIARLEGGGARPSNRTLEGIASASGSRLRVLLQAA
jgi:DNA-binding XRE family transcriptional regulator